MKYYMLSIPAGNVAQMTRYMKMAMRFKPEMVEDAVLKVVVEDDLDEEQIKAGIGMEIYADEPTYKLARQMGGPTAVEVDTIPAIAQDAVDIL